MAANRAKYTAPLLPCVRQHDRHRAIYARTHARTHTQTHSALHNRVTLYAIRTHNAPWEGRRVGPQEVAHRAGVRRLPVAVNLGELLELDAVLGQQPAVGHEHAVCACRTTTTTTTTTTITTTTTTTTTVHCNRPLPAPSPCPISATLFTPGSRTRGRPGVPLMRVLLLVVRRLLLLLLLLPSKSGPL